MVRAGFVPLLVHMLECTTRPGVAVHAAFIRRAASTILARLANRSPHLYSSRLAILECSSVLYTPLAIPWSKLFNSANKRVLCRCHLLLRTNFGVCIIHPLANNRSFRGTLYLTSFYMCYIAQARSSGALRCCVQMSFWE